MRFLIEPLRRCTFLALLLLVPAGREAFGQEQAVQNTPDPGTSAQQPASPASPAPSTADTSQPGQSGISDSSLRLGAGDLLEVSVYDVPELATKTRVGSNGDVYLPLIDYVHLAGLTAEQAQELIEKRLSDGGFVKNPHVSLFVDQYASQNASVLGEVMRPGQYPVMGEQRLFDLISAAGGFTEKAGRGITITHRDQPDKPVTVQLTRRNLDSSDGNIEIYPSDTILVHRADIVYVVGDVGRPSGFLMEGGNLTVLKAIALAGGANRTAKLNGARIIRKDSTGMTETPVQLKKILAAKAPDLPMQAEDILFVPAGRMATARLAQAALQAATSVAIVAAVP